MLISTFSKLLLLICLLHVRSRSMKVYEAGINDWNLLNIGQIQQVKFQPQTIFFTTNDTIGLLNSLNGQLISRRIMHRGDQIHGIDQNNVIVSTAKNQIITYSTFTLNKIVTPVLHNIPSQKVHSSFPTFFATNYNIYLIRKKTIKAIQSKPFNNLDAKIHQKYHKLYTSYLSYCAISSSYTQGSYKICKSQFTNNQNQILFHPKKQCFSLEYNLTLQIENIYELPTNLILSSNHLSLILTTQFSLVRKIQSKVCSYNTNYITFTSGMSLDLATNNLVQLYMIIDSAKQQFIMRQQSDATYEITNSHGIHFRIRKPSEYIHVGRIWMHFKSSNHYHILIQYSDMQLVLYDTKYSLENPKWTREQSLAYVNKAIFMHYPEKDNLDNPYHRSLNTHEYRSLGWFEKIYEIPQIFLLRIIEQLKDIKLAAENIFYYVKKHINELKMINWNQIAKFKMSAKQQQYYGLRKYIVLCTEYNTIYGIDSKNISILWKINLKENHKIRVLSLVQLHTDYQTQAIVMISYNKQEQETIIQEISANGEIIPYKSYKMLNQPTIHKINDQSIMLYSVDGAVKFQLTQSTNYVHRQYYFYQQQKNQIIGWKQLGSYRNQIWNIRFMDDQIITTTVSPYLHNTKIPLFDDQKVYFKNVDYANLAILTYKQKINEINLYIVNGITGQVQFHQNKKYVNINLPINLAYDDNNVLITYYNMLNKIYEIWTVEAYQTNFKTSAIAMITDYLENRQYYPQRNRPQIIFVSQVYGSPVSIKKMFISSSKMSLIRRNMIVITSENKIYSIGRELISIWRPKPESFFKNNNYPPYSYLIPYSSGAYLTYNKILHNMENIYISGTNLESSIFILAYGRDIFMIRSAPDQNFDMITENFNYLLLLGIMTVVTILVLFIRNRAEAARIRRPYTD